MYHKLWEDSAEFAVSELSNFDFRENDQAVGTLQRKRFRV